MLFRAGPFAAITLSPAGDDDGTRPIVQEPLEIDLTVNVVEAELDELGALADKVLLLGDHVPMTATGNAYANHGCE